MGIETLNIDKAKLLNAVAEKIADRVYSEMTGSISSEDAPNGRKRRRSKRAATKARDVTDEQILALLREKGPLRVVEIMDVTGLTLSAAHKKMGSLKAAKAVQPLKEGTVVRYGATRGGARKAGRKTAARKKTRKTTSRKKKAASARSAIPAATS